MRLMMKYKEIAGSTDAATDLVNFSRRTKALDRLLHDETRSGVLLVSLDEPSVRAETTRLATLLRATGVSVLGEVRNRAALDGAADGTSVVIAPELAKPLVGVEAIREWTSTWERPHAR